MIDLEHQEQQEEAFPWEEDLQRLQDALVWDGKQYQGAVCLQEWEGYFQRQEPYPLLVRVGELTDLQVVQGCRDFLERQYQILDVMMTALTDRYPLMQLEYGHLMSENAPEMPNILDKNDFAELLYPQRLILDLEKGCVLAAFDCTWDREKGFGIVVRGEEVLQMDTAEIVPEWEPFEREEPLQGEQDSTEQDEQEQEGQSSQTAAEETAGGEQ